MRCVFFRMSSFNRWGSLTFLSMHSNRSLSRFVWMRWLHFPGTSAETYKQNQGRSLHFFCFFLWQIWRALRMYVHPDKHRAEAAWVTNHYKLSKKFVLVQDIAPFHFRCVYDPLGKIKSHLYQRLHSTLHWNRDEDDKATREKKIWRKTSINKDTRAHTHTHTRIHFDKIFYWSFYSICSSGHFNWLRQKKIWFLLLFVRYFWRWL